VVGAQARLEDRQGTLVQAAGALEVALVTQDDREVVEDSGCPRVVGP
jgi:hypothetical protein